MRFETGKGYGNISLDEILPPKEGDQRSYVKFIEIFLFDIRGSEREVQIVLMVP